MNDRPKIRRTSVEEFIEEIEVPEGMMVCNWCNGQGYGDFSGNMCYGMGATPTYTHCAWCNGQGMVVDIDAKRETLRRRREEG